MLKRFTFRHLVYLRQIILQFYRDKLYWSLGLAVAFALVIYLLNNILYLNDFWNDFATKKGIDVWFCEHTDMKKFVRQPINTFTNIWYLVNAIFFLSKGLSDYRKPKSFNLITANPYYSILLGLTSIYTFICSTFFHSSLLIIASKLDFSAVYSIALFPLMYYSHRIILHKRNKSTHLKHPKEVKTLIAIFTLIYILLTFFIPLAYVHSIVLTCIVLTAMGGLYLEKNVQNKSNRLYLILMIVFITIAIILFKMDISKIACNPDSFLQAHSLWHIFNSMTVFYIYLYFRSENYNPSEDKKIAHLRSEI